MHLRRVAASYPVVEGIRTKESATPAEEAVLAATTKSALTATRKSTNYAKASFAAGFGSDVSFQTVDSAGVTTELGAIGMQHTGDGTSNADIVFKTWNGADTTGYTGDQNGYYVRMRITSNGDVIVRGWSMTGIAIALVVTSSVLFAWAFALTVMLIMGNKRTKNANVSYSTTSPAVPQKVRTLPLRLRSNYGHTPCLLRYSSPSGALLTHSFHAHRS